LKHIFDYGTDTRAVEIYNTYKELKPEKEKGEASDSFKIYNTYKELKPSMRK